MIEDQPLTKHFSLYDLTKTSHTEFQDENRNLSPFQVMKLTKVAELLEHVLFILGCAVTVTSGYRSPKLNEAVGSAPTSQHLLCEAADFVPLGKDLGSCFELLKRDVLEANANVGQLILEKAERGETSVEWIHISLGLPYRDAGKCKEILTMKNGIYTRIA